MEKFKEDEPTGKDCPVCGRHLIFFMGFTDCFSHTTGHYTTDRPMIVCSDDKCEYSEDYIEDYKKNYDGDE